MKKTLLAFAAATALATIASVAVPTRADAQVFVYEGGRYCFYFDGWHGPGWYRCGYRWRQGLGWGGEYGWHGWRHSGWERRGHRHGGEVRIQRGGPEFGVNTRNRTHMRGEMQRGPRVGGEMQRGPRGGGEMRATTGAGPRGPVLGGGRMEMRSGGGGGAAAPAARGGGGGGGPQGGAEKRP